jgi:hypothetical protein
MLRSVQLSFLHCCRPNRAGSCSRNCAGCTSWEFQHRAERFLPPYFFSSSRPDIVSLSGRELRYGASLNVTYRGTVTGAVLLTPGAVTHQVGWDHYVSAAS